jgi:hypothetical protein
MKIFNFEITRVRKNTVFHPDYRLKTEFAFNLHGVEYFWFNNLLDMPVKRYQKCSQFISETSLRLSREDIEQYTDVITKALNEGNITRASMMLGELKYQNEMFIEADTFFRLYSCVFFTKDEDLTDYDFEIGDKKIEEFKKGKVEDFFLSEPCKKFLPQLDISTEDLNMFLKVSETRKKFRHLLKEGS